MVVMSEAPIDSLFLTIARVDDVGQAPSILPERTRIGMFGFSGNVPIPVDIADPGEPGIYYIKLEGEGAVDSPDMIPIWLLHPRAN